MISMSSYCHLYDFHLIHDHRHRSAVLALYVHNDRCRTATDYKSRSIIAHLTFTLFHLFLREGKKI